MERMSHSAEHIATHLERDLPPKSEWVWEFLSRKVVVPEDLVVKKVRLSATMVGDEDEDEDEDEDGDGKDTELFLFRRHLRLSSLRHLFVFTEV